MGEILERGHVRCEVERIEGRGRSPTVRRVMSPDVAICFDGAVSREGHDKASVVSSPLSRKDQPGYQMNRALTSSLDFAMPHDRSKFHCCESSRCDLEVVGCDLKAVESCDSPMNLFEGLKVCDRQQHVRWIDHQQRLRQQ